VQRLLSALAFSSYALSLQLTVLYLTPPLQTAKRVVFSMPVARPTLVRAFGGHAPAKPSGDVVIPEIVDTLEWVLESPPNVHQFDEPPIVVEIEHLDALIQHDH
jgi:hypothetical protein